MMKSALSSPSRNNHRLEGDFRLAIDDTAAKPPSHGLEVEGSGGGDGDQGNVKDKDTAAITAGSHESEMLPATQQQHVPPADSPTRSLQSEAPHTESLIESSSAESVATPRDRHSSHSHSHGGNTNGLAARGRRGSATMKSFLQRVMRSQSESHIRITPVSQSQQTTTNNKPLSAGIVGRKLASPCSTSQAAAGRDDAALSLAVGNCPSDSMAAEAETNNIGGAVGGSSSLLGQEDGNAAMERSRQHQRATSQQAADASLCDVFLNSSLQLLQVQSDTKQRVRQLWTCAQKLKWENQLSDAGLELLHQELLQVMKALTVEKLEGARHIKSGYLTLVQAPPAVVAANALQRGAAAATKSLLFGSGKTTVDQRMFVSISEEQCRMELVPARSCEVQQDGATAQPSSQPSSTPSAAADTDDSSRTSTSSSSNSTTSTNGSATFPGIGKFKLPTSISWLLSDPLHQQQKDDESSWIGRTVIKLQGCQVRRMPLHHNTAAAPVDGPWPSSSSCLRFQVLVPTNSDPHIPTSQSSSTHGSTTPIVVPDPSSSSSSSSSSYGIYVFDVQEADGETERDDWIRAIDRVSVFHLYALESQLREACYMLQFREILTRGFPVCVPLTWLRNRVERMPSSATSFTPQQQATYQYQQLQRRSSRNLSMVQIVKDLERDRILVDHKLLISCMGSRQPQAGETTTPKPMATLSDGTVVVEHDSVAEIVKYLVAKAMAFAKRTAAPRSKAKPPTNTSSASSSSSASVGPSSPSSRLSKFTEARALAFVERVLRGGSRTQSGGDIYDAIAFFCQQRHLSICPMSHDAHPVQLNVIEDHVDDEDPQGGDFHIEIEVTMQFKVVELAPMMMPSGHSHGHGHHHGGSTHMEMDPRMIDAVSMPRDWAVLEGRLTRQFTLGKLSEPGSVFVKYIPETDDQEMTTTTTSHT